MSKTFAEVLGDIGTAFAQAALLEDEKKKVLESKAMFAAAKDLLKTIKDIPDNEIQVASTLVRAYCVNQEKVKYVELNNTLQRFLLAKTEDDNVQQFVKANMD